ncbi:MAG: tRNA (N6-isopentenyl adenosine(37)-C2)-methylthiotransferase MiaB [Alphaproteobacteria bacterium]|nr:tRNA (N6-isopentenyl adenosine(37)-C2)-methylthiotransferase MiaB [Alphaproteobacteria bacterium]
MSANAATRKKLYIKTYGCQMNSYDTKRMEDILRPLGYDAAQDAVNADMVILNTCHIREKATDKVFSDLGRIRLLKTAKEKQGGQMVVAVAGCVAQAEGDVILSRARYVDMVFGPQTYYQLPEMVAKITGAYGAERIINTDFPIEEKFDHLPQENQVTGPAAFLSIQEGCDKFCTFCVVPYTRGAEYSRAASDILAEAARLIAGGARDITLLGQNVNAYHGRGSDGSVWSLARLLQELQNMDGIERLRYTTSHPCDVTDDLIAAHRDLPKVMPYLHLPVQSGSDKILKAMNRKHTAQSYFDTIDKFRTARPDIALSSDFIIGFPGETDDDFAQTYQMVEQIGFAAAYSFKYSARPGTPAANMQNLVREDVKDQRLQSLQSLIQKQSESFNQSFVNSQVSVLIDDFNAPEMRLHGRTPHNQSVHINLKPSDNVAGNISPTLPSAISPLPQRLVGQTLPVRTTSAGVMALHGSLVVA